MLPATPCEIASGLNQMNAMKVAGEVKRRESLLDLVRLAACFLVVFHHAAVALIFGDDYEIVTPMLVKLQNVIIRVCTVGEGTPIFFVLAGWLVVNTLEKSAGAINNLNTQYAIQPAGYQGNTKRFHMINMNLSVIHAFTWSEKQILFQTFYSKTIE